MVVFSSDQHVVSDGPLVPFPSLLWVFSLSPSESSESGVGSRVLLRIKRRLNRHRAGWRSPLSLSTGKPMPPHIAHLAPVARPARSAEQVDRTSMCMTEPRVSRKGYAVRGCGEGCGGGLPPNAIVEIETRRVTSPHSAQAGTHGPSPARGLLLATAAGDRRVVPVHAEIFAGLGLGACVGCVGLGPLDQLALGQLFNLERTRLGVVTTPPVRLCAEADPLGFLSAFQGLRGSREGWSGEGPRLAAWRGTYSTAHPSRHCRTRQST